jgi:glyoxylase-like metal-dependent hydrolase (beta-lactamase superfamily II)
MEKQKENMKVRAELKEISSGVYAFIQHRGEWFVSNAGLIVGEKFAVVVDSLTNESMARAFIRKIREVTDKPLKFLLNTHGDADHVWTNHLFGTTTICHENCREDTMRAHPEIYSVLFPELDFSGANITPQDITVNEKMKIYMENREIEAIHPGIAHSTGDLFIYLPKEKIVFCGDLLFSSKCTPFAMFGSISGSIEALKKLYELNADFYVPGHGDIAGKDEIQENISYYLFVQNEAKKCFEKGLNLYEFLQKLELGEYENWFESERIVGNLARAYSELTGETFDLLEVARLMFQRKNNKIK